MSGTMRGVQWVLVCVSVLLFTERCDANVHLRPVILEMTPNAAGAGTVGGAGSGVHADFITFENQESIKSGTYGGSGGLVHSNTANFATAKTGGHTFGDAAGGPVEFAQHGAAGAAITNGAAAHGGTGAHNSLVGVIPMFNIGIGLVDDETETQKHSEYAGAAYSGTAHVGAVGESGNHGGVVFGSTPHQHTDHTSSTYVGVVNTNNHASQDAAAAGHHPLHHVHHANHGGVGLGIGVTTEAQPSKYTGSYEGSSGVVRHQEKEGFEVHTKPHPGIYIGSGTNVVGSGHNSGATYSGTVSTSDTVSHTESGNYGGHVSTPIVHEKQHHHNTFVLTAPTISTPEHGTGIVFSMGAGSADAGAGTYSVSNRAGSETYSTSTNTGTATNGIGLGGASISLGEQESHVDQSKKYTIGYETTDDQYNTGYYGGSYGGTGESIAVGTNYNEGAYGTSGASVGYNSGSYGVNDGSIVLESDYNEESYGTNGGSVGFNVGTYGVNGGSAVGATDYSGSYGVGGATIDAGSYDTGTYGTTGETVVETTGYEKVTYGGSGGTEYNVGSYGTSGEATIGIIGSDKDSYISTGETDGGLIGVTGYTEDTYITSGESNGANVGVSLEPAVGTSFSSAGNQVGTEYYITPVSGGEYGNNNQRYGIGAILEEDIGEIDLTSGTNYVTNGAYGTSGNSAGLYTTNNVVKETQGVYNTYDTNYRVTGGNEGLGVSGTYGGNNYANGYIRPAVATEQYAGSVGVIPEIHLSQKPGYAVIKEHHKVTTHGHDGNGVHFNLGQTTHPVGHVNPGVISVGAHAPGVEYHTGSVNAHVPGVTHHSGTVNTHAHAPGVQYHLGTVNAHVPGVEYHTGSVGAQVPGVEYHSGTAHQHSSSGHYAGGFGGAPGIVVATGQPTYGSGHSTAGIGVTAGGYGDAASNIHYQGSANVAEVGTGGNDHTGHHHHHHHHHHHSGHSANIEAGTGVGGSVGTGGHASGSAGQSGSLLGDLFGMVVGGVGGGSSGSGVGFGVNTASTSGGASSFVGPVGFGGQVSYLSSESGSGSADTDSLERISSFNK